MATKTTQSGILSKFGSRVADAVKQHAADPVRKGIIRLPGGIKSGTAQLVECYFKTREDKSVFFRASGTVKRPKTVIEDGESISIYGLPTSIVVDITEENFNDNIGDITNHLKLLAGADFITNNEGMSLEDLVQLVNDEASKSPIYFRFSTTKSDPVLNKDGSIKFKERVWENWHGTEGCEDFTEGDTTAEHNVDNTGPKPSVNGKAHQAQEEDLDALAELAKNGDEDVKGKLKGMAMEKGFSEEDVDNTDTWAQVVTMIREGKKEEVKTETEREPKLKDAVGYAPPDKKGGKQKEKQCVVDSVSKKNKTVNLTNLADKAKKYEDVPWTDLVYASS